MAFAPSITFYVALTLLTTVSASLSSSNTIEARQSIPDVLPANWTSVGCFTDISTARTLAAEFMASPQNMTIESCIAFCANAGFIYAGVEFTEECYCDSTIQIPGEPAALSDCSLPCTGNTSEICGGSGRLSVFTSGAPAPVLVSDVGGSWSYQGCFTDNTENRTLNVPVNIPQGVTAESCTAACKSLGGFVQAGLEDGHECWCDNSVNPITQHVSDDDCRAVCTADHNEYCGNANRIAVYRFTEPGSTPPQQTCTTDMDDFTLLAVYNNPPVSGPSSLNIKAVLVELVPNTFWTILSACSTCCSDWTSFSLKNSVFLPQSASNPGQLMSSTAPSDGESPAFVASSPPFPGFQAYCAEENPSGASNAPSILSFAGKSDAFSLCVNSTANANGRLDVVFSPVTNHPHYSFDSCNPVTIQILPEV